MPKKIDYPRAPLSRALELAQAINAYGGKATIESAAEKLGVKVSGAFNSLVSSAAKYGLVESDGKSSGGGRQLVTSSLYRQYKLAYSDDERREVLQKAALGPPVFAAIHDRFTGQQLPHDYLDNLLVREYQVSEPEASRVRGYLLEAFSFAGLIDDDYRVTSGSQDEEENPDPTLEVAREPDTPRPAHLMQGGGAAQQPGGASTREQYEITIVGPDLNTRVVVREPDDFDMVDVAIKRIRGRIERQTQIQAQRGSEGANEDEDLLA
ncbi:hypothetical protein [Thioalkalivibrio sp. ALE17]|uniref:hypothetical protein n=1 Tax=Thioalkalivibrio sp. ALE17 TaxID=1158173 RepID=UPI0012DEF020|nr:hypothetical protein [Thioalkalivibrio sp. ALE17]